MMPGLLRSRDGHPSGHAHHHHHHPYAPAPAALPLLPPPQPQQGYQAYRAMNPALAHAIARLPPPPTRIPAISATMGAPGPANYYAQAQQPQPQPYMTTNPFAFGTPFAPAQQWARAPGAERRSTDFGPRMPQLEYVPEPMIAQQGVYAPAAAAMQQPVVPVEPAPHSVEATAKSAVPLAGFAAEVIWEMVYSSSPAVDIVKDLSQPPTPKNEDVAVFSPFAYDAHKSAFGDGHAQHRGPSIAGADDYFATSPMRAQRSEPTPAFRRWCYSVLTQTALSKPALFLALYYASHLPIHEAPGSGSAGDSLPHRLLTLGLALANRWLDDNTYTNKTWSDVTGIALSDLNALDMWALASVKLDVNISSDTWIDWLHRVRARERRLDSSRPTPRHHHGVSPVAQQLWAEGRTEPRAAVAAVDEVLHTQYAADHKHAMEFSQQAVAARYRAMPPLIAPIDVQLIQLGPPSPVASPVQPMHALPPNAIDLDEDGPLRPLHHRSSTQLSPENVVYPRRTSDMPVSSLGGRAPFGDLAITGRRVSEPIFALPPMRSSVSFDAAAPAASNDDSWGRIGRTRSSLSRHWGPAGPPVIAPPLRQSAGQPSFCRPDGRSWTLGGGLGIGGFGVDYRRGVMA